MKRKTGHVSVRDNDGVDRDKKTGGTLERWACIDLFGSSRELGWGKGWEPHCEGNGMGLGCQAENNSGLQTVDLKNEGMVF